MAAITNADILGIMQSFQDDIGKELLNKKIPVKLSYAIKHNLNKISDAYKTYEETLKSLAMQYDAELGSKGIKAKTPEEQKEVNKELINLLQEEVDIEFKKVPLKVIEQCGEGAYDALTFSEIERIDWLIEDNDQDE